VAVSLDDKLDGEVLKVVSESGEHFECQIRVSLSGFTGDQEQQLRSAASTLDAISTECREEGRDVKLHWDNGPRFLVMQVASTVNDPESWFQMYRDVIPQLIGRVLDLDVSHLSQLTECRLRKPT
jgi:hypothetical protein